VFAIIDNTGDYGIGKTPQEAASNYEENIQSLSDAECTRVVKVMLSVPLPRPVELNGVVAAESASDAQLVSAN
jgi:hypothetical protein